VANLFLTKTVWATLMAIAVGIVLVPYPFLPRHLTIIDTLAIGIPSFFLALAPNLRRYIPGFVDRVLWFTIPAGGVVAATTLSAYFVVRAHGSPLVEQRTAAAIVALMLSLAVLVLLAAPLTWRRLLLVGAVVVAFVLLFPLRAVRDFYSLALPHGALGVTLLIGGLGVAAMVALWFLLRRLGHGPVAVVRGETS
jgi:cation-transporting ATPase E